MAWSNSKNSWGWTSILIHWLTAVTVFTLFGLGLWMVELTYYDEWYKKGPDLHRAIGVLLFILTALRLVWRKSRPTPESLPNHQRWEIGLAHTVHALLYLLLFAIMFSGYLISTADSRGVDIFGLFSIPATITSIPQQEEVAGVVHFYLACSLIGLVILHAAGALKHHVIDKDRTLTRMIKPTNNL
ncbi:MAG: cytochrome b [Candidatus Sedimenticola sp. (ex Thyasira tokunagai)]